MTIEDAYARLGEQLVREIEQTNDILAAMEAGRRIKREADARRLIESLKERTDSRAEHDACKAWLGGRS